MASILFVHNNFPAQFRFLAEQLPRRGHRCAAVSSKTGRQVGGLPLARWSVGRGTSPGIYVPATRAEADMLRGAAAARAATALKERGFTPDLIIGHPGWGETVFLRELFPKARQILYGEFFYRSYGADVGFDPEFGEPGWDERLRIYGKNATGTLAYAECDRIVTPTDFQASVFPPLLRERIRIIHEGVETETVKPGQRKTVTLGGGTVLDGSAPLVTFINRRFEPMRGFHTFMRALPAFQAAVPNGQVVLIGSDEAGGYGASAGEGTTWKARLMTELQGKLDLTRIHFTGTVPNAEMHALLALGSAHVYLTYPFALSWSLLEAMALECLVIGSANPPVRDVIADGENGMLVDMLDPAAVAFAMVEACLRPREDFAEMRHAARKTVVDRFDRRRICQPAWLKLVDEVLAL